MNTPHPYRQAAGRIGCADCGKPRTHMNHLHQGEGEPEEFPPDAQEPGFRMTPGVPHQPIDESSFSITSSGGYTTVLIKVAGPVTPELLQAASIFMQEAQPRGEEK